INVNKRTLSSSIVSNRNRRQWLDAYGLSITRSIIHAHGGELSAEQQGREIVFKVRLLMD
ncbi:ATP-binding protein, partial [Enterobacter roggenkampii]